MRLWRICREQFAADPLSGRGGLVASGRWSTKGKRIVYTADTLSLAALEYLVQVDRNLLPPDLVQLEIEIPDRFTVPRVDVKPLPKNWRTYPAPVALQKIGDKWIEEQASAAVRVPSVIIQEECNVLLNPEHPDASGFKLISQKAFRYDSRLRT